MGSVIRLEQSDDVCKNCGIIRSAWLVSILVYIEIASMVTNECVDGLKVNVFNS